MFRTVATIFKPTEKKGGLETKISCERMPGYLSLGDEKKSNLKDFMMKRKKKSKA